MCQIKKSYKGSKTRLPGWKVVFVDIDGQYRSAATGQLYVSGKSFADRAMYRADSSMHIAGFLLQTYVLQVHPHYTGQTGLFIRKWDAECFKKVFERYLPGLSIIKMELSGNPLHHGVVEWHCERRSVYVGNTLYFTQPTVQKVNNR